jgi:hypothetical protein
MIMAQRKAKEPLLAEVPRPRLSDEELMELFYSRPRTEERQLKDDVVVRGSPEISSGITTEESPTPTSQREEKKLSPPERSDKTHTDETVTKPSLREGIL